MGDVALRPEGPQDVTLLRELYASTRAAEMAAWPWDDARKNAFLRMQFEAQKQHYHRAYPEAAFQIIVVDGRPAGRLYVQHRDDEVLLIDISLLPAYRDRGIGSELLRTLLAEASRLGRCVRLHVERHSAARRLYERLGFRELADEGIYLLLEWTDPHVSWDLTISETRDTTSGVSGRKA